MAQARNMPQLVQPVAAPSGATMAPTQQQLVYMQAQQARMGQSKMHLANLHENNFFVEIYLFFYIVDCVQL